MLNLLGSIAQFERELMLERQREGISKAKAEASTRVARPLLVRSQMRSSVSTAPVSVLSR